MRMIIMGLVALIVLGGGGAGAYFYFMKPAEASAGEEHADKAKKEEPKKDAHGKEGGVTEFVELDPLILPVIGKDGISEVVSMIVAVEVGDAESAAKVKAMSPKLKDAYIQDMYGVLNERQGMKDGVIQVGAIKKRLNVVTSKILGEDVSNGVLLQFVQQHPI